MYAGGSSFTVDVKRVKILLSSHEKALLGERGSHHESNLGQKEGNVGLMREGTRVDGSQVR